MDITLGSAWKFVRVHADWLLGLFALGLIALIVWFLVWGITSLAQDLGTALGSPEPPNAEAGFNLQSASQLDFRGLNGAN